MPTTTQVFTDRTPMPFGRYKDKALADVPAVYLLWLMAQGCQHPGVRGYINNNYEALQQEAANAKKFKR